AWGAPARAIRSVLRLKPRAWRRPRADAISSQAPKRGRRELLRSEAVDVDDRLRKGLGRLLRQIVPDAARDGPMRILAREFLSIGAAVWMWRTIGITLEGNGGHADDRTSGQLLFQIV